MQVTLEALLSAEDAAQRALYQIPDPAGQGAASRTPEVFPGGHFRSPAALARRLAHLDSRPARPGLKEFLRRENAFAPLTPEQDSSLEASGEPGAVFMLTGQQPGLLGGPILWYYKALTCAALAREWSTRLSRPVIPVFWVAGDDADLEECNHVELLDARGGAVPGPLRLSFPDPALTLAMGERRIDPEGMEDLLLRLSRAWRPGTVDSLRRCYPADCSLSEGFLRLAQSRLGREGILFVDGYSRELRSRVRPVLDAAVSDWKGHQDALLRGTAAAAAAGIPAQVELRAGVVHAFALLNGERRRLFAERTASGSDTVYTPDRPGQNLRGRLAGMELSHDVFTRPLAADALFPVLGHVLGPAELRYFAQLAPLFLESTGDMPLVHPRMTAAVAPAAAFEDFRAEGLDLRDAIRLGPSRLRSRLADRHWRAHPASTALSAAPVEAWLAEMRAVHGRHFRDTGPIDRFERAFGGAWKRYLGSLERLAFAGEAENKRGLFDHLRWLGNGMGQDRHLGLGSLIDALGEDGFSALREAIDPIRTELQLFAFGGS